jgi:hypothetical protein
MLFLGIFDAPAETTNYMILGFGVIFCVMLVHILSLYIRWRNLKRDLALLSEIENQEN